MKKCSTEWDVVKKKLLQDYFIILLFWGNRFEYGANMHSARFNRNIHEAKACFQKAAFLSVDSYAKLV